MAWWYTFSISPFLALSPTAFIIDDGSPNAVGQAQILPDFTYFATSSALVNFFL